MVTQVFLDIDTGYLLDALNDTESLVSAFNDGRVLSRINKVVWDGMKHGFQNHVDDVARMSATSDPRGQGDFHHLYENGHVGDSAERLFEFKFPKEIREGSRAETYVAIDFKQAKLPGSSFGIRKSKWSAEYDENRIYPPSANKIPPFRNKAKVFEQGLPINIVKGRFVVRAKPNYKNASGTMPFINGARVETSEFATYHRLYEEFAMWVASTRSRGIVAERVNVINKYAVERMIQKFRNNLIAMRTKGSYEGPQRSLNWRFFSKTNKATHLSNQYRDILDRALATLDGGGDA